MSRASGMSASMQRGCYEETGPVEFRLYGLDDPLPVSPVAFVGVVYFQVVFCPVSVFIMTREAVDLEHEMTASFTDCVDISLI